MFASSAGNSAGLASQVQDREVRVSASGVPATVTTPPAPPPCDTTVSVLYCVYTIQPGETLSSIAEKFGVQNGDLPGWRILAESNKPDVSDPDDVADGQKLRIPTRQAILHTVRSGQTLSDIAETYDVSMASIIALDINRISDVNALKVGDEVLVPGAQRFAKPLPVLAPVGSSAAAAASAQIVRGGQASQSGFIWPVTGPISSYFGPAHPLGIDIDLYSSPTAPIGAAAAGTVVFAGGNPCCSYGLNVIIDHGNGFETQYAHLSVIAVSVGQHVSQGQLLGNGGRTGYATGPHLHFEVHLRGAIVNPLVYLP